MANYIFHLYPNGAYQRVTHYNDVVPHVPPREVFGNIHSGNEVWYPHQNDNNNIKICSNAAS